MKEEIIEDHKWSIDDTILTLYYVLYGTDKLSVRDHIELVEWVIGSVEISLLRQAANIRHYYVDMGYALDWGKSYMLSDHSKIQRKVVELYKDESEEDLREIVEWIISKTDVEANKLIVAERAEQKYRTDKIRFIEESTKSIRQRIQLLNTRAANMYRNGLGDQWQRDIDFNKQQIVFNKMELDSLNKSNIK